MSYLNGHTSLLRVNIVDNENFHTKSEIDTKMNSLKTETTSIIANTVSNIKQYITIWAEENGSLTWFLERIFNQSDILHSHSILHDAFGRFYDHCSLD